MQNFIPNKCICPILSGFSNLLHWYIEALILKLQEKEPKRTCDLFRGQQYFATCLKIRGSIWSLCPFFLLTHNAKVLVQHLIFGGENGSCLETLKNFVSLSLLMIMVQIFKMGDSSLLNVACNVKVRAELLKKSTLDQWLPIFQRCS